MEGFEWLQVAVGLASPDELQQQGATVYFSPDVPEHVRVVNLVNGRVVQFPEVGEHPPDEGYYADYDSLLSFAREHSIPLCDADGRIVREPAPLPPSAGSERGGYEEEEVPIAGGAS